MPIPVVFLQEFTKICFNDFRFSENAIKLFNGLLKSRLPYASRPCMPSPPSFLRAGQKHMVVIFMVSNTYELKWGWVKLSINSSNKNSTPTSLHSKMEPHPETGVLNVKYTTTSTHLAPHDCMLPKPAVKHTMPKLSLFCFVLHA